MKIFPAIDIKDKKCVRLVKGNFDNKTEYEITPAEQAGKYKDYGFKNLHIVDLDGALTGETVNQNVIKGHLRTFIMPIHHIKHGGSPGQHVLATTFVQSN